MNSCLYEGAVRHRRFEPVAHEFRYRLFMVYLDLSELDTVFKGRWFWAVERWSLACFMRTDHQGPANISLEQSIRDLVQERTGVRPSGAIRLLTHLRYFGYCFNPVSFYYCMDANDQKVEVVVAEVNNTPWGERHCYVLSSKMDVGRPGRRRYKFNKEFHVSPFMKMTQNYDWRFSDPSQRLDIHMDTFEEGMKLFDATMGLTRKPINSRSLAAALLRFPFMTAQVIVAIYIQALRLRIKRAPFIPHPASVSR